jgi:AcrR family transcriptional regulator
MVQPTDAATCEILRVRESLADRWPIRKNLQVRKEGAMSAGINTKPPIGALRHAPRPRDAEEVPVGSLVKTPLGLEARVIAHRGFRRGHRVWLVCRYVQPVNRRFDVAQILPELVTILSLKWETEMGRKAATKATPEKEVNDLAKAVFLARLVDAMTITVAAESAGIDRATAYRWRESDAEFAEAWDAALEAGTDRLEQEAIRRARDGVEEPVVYQGQLTPIFERNEDGSVRMVDLEEPDGQGGTRVVRTPVLARDADGNPRYLTLRKPSDTLMIFLLKARRPDTYRERVSAELTGKGGKDLPGPASGVLVVPGLMPDTAAWAAAVQGAAVKQGSE